MPRGVDALGAVVGGGDVEKEGVGGGRDVGLEGGGDLRTEELDGDLADGGDGGELETGGGGGGELEERTGSSVEI